MIECGGDLPRGSIGKLITCARGLTLDICRVRRTSGIWSEANVRIGATWLAKLAEVVIVVARKAALIIPFLKRCPSPEANNCRG
jgi:hypothetical protein